ncbi:hypothetical protein KYE46_04880 [Gymnodinialimonas ceratoperidinii]|uniref:RNase NYN domain-containing protein n=2 Tax=Gymnodinialimonas ceratoperidinii TaxID=2856823 RepID=A0A8F6U0Y3_9RHOB|nr:hypothetical protein KYE46_04880 [Gymnodinialimonas ceratoperidinii]
MRTPLVLLALSLTSFGALYTANGPELTLPLAVIALAGIAATILALKAAFQGRNLRLTRRSSHEPEPLKSEITPRRKPRHFNHVAPKRVTRKPAGPRVVIDGSNVMHWNGAEPRLTTVREVVSALRTQGYQPGVVFDANAGYKLTDSYMDDRDFAKLLNLPGDCVVVVARGEPADPTILAAARDLKAKVITNDRFRDWADDFPEVATPGTLIKGGYDHGALWLDDRALAS